eukprot:COSAG02_NODE_29520_length_567_cov_2.811966_1_plen_168_part_00
MRKFFGDALSRLKNSTSDMATESIEFQDFVREKQAMVADIELMMMDSSFREEFMAADAVIKELGGEDDHITADLPTRWTEFVDFNGVEAMNSELVSQQTLDITKECNQQTYRECPQFASVYETLASASTADDHSSTAAGDSGKQTAAGEISGDTHSSTASMAISWGC